MADWDGAGYERISGLQRHLARESLANLEFRGDERVLDVGCGDGFVTRAIAARLPNGSIVGVDASPRMIEAARAHPDPPGAAVTFERGDVLDLAFAAEFDIVVSFNALHWVADQVGALSAIARATRIDGRVIVQQVCSGPRASLEATAMTVCGRPRWAGFFLGFDAPFTHVDPADYPAVARRAGLRVTDQLVRDLRWDFDSGAEFVDWCTVGFADWTARLPAAEVGAWVDDVVDAYQAVVGEPAVLRFMQMRSQMVRSHD